MLHLHWLQVRESSGNAGHVWPVLRALLRQQETILDRCCHQVSLASHAETDPHLQFAYRCGIRRQSLATRFQFTLLLFFASNARHASSPIKLGDALTSGPSHFHATAPLSQQSSAKQTQHDIALPSRLSHHRFTSPLNSNNISHPVVCAGLARGLTSGVRRCIYRQHLHSRRQPSSPDPAPTLRQRACFCLYA